MQIYFFDVGCVEMVANGSQIARGAFSPQSSTEGKYNRFGAFVDLLLPRVYLIIVISALSN